MDVREDFEHALERAVDAVVRVLGLPRPDAELVGAAHVGIAPSSRPCTVVAFRIGATEAGSKQACIISDLPNRILIIPLKRSISWIKQKKKRNTSPSCQRRVETKGMGNRKVMCIIRGYLHQEYTGIRG